MIHPGIYNEGLVIDKPLEIEGEGDLGEVVIQTTGEHTVLFKASIGQVRNLTLRQNGGKIWNCVEITQGQLLLEECDISSQSSACICIHHYLGANSHLSANPTMRNNRIHDGGIIHVFELPGDGIEVPKIP